MSVDPFLKGYDEQALRDLVEGGAKELNRRGIEVNVIYGEAARLAIEQSTEPVEEPTATDSHHETQITHDETGLQSPRA